MSIQCTEKIPFADIVKIGVWSNQSTKNTIANVYKKLTTQYPSKLVYIMNGGFFDMNTKLTPCFGCKADNQVLANDWLGTCYMAMRGNTIKFFRQNTPLNSQYSDAISGYPALIEGGKKSANFHNAADGYSNRGRTMIGYNATHLVISCIADVSGSADFTATEEYEYMLAQGCTYAMSLDGGGSSQCIFNGSKITSSRIVSNFVYVIANKNTTTAPTTTTPTAGSNLKKDIQTWLNQTYNAGLTVDGILGALSAKAIIKGMQIECKVTADGIWGPNSQNAFKLLKYGTVNNTKNKVKLLQAALCRKGYWAGEFNGSFDLELKNQVMLYQRAMKLDVDGCVGPATIRSLFS